MEKEIFQSALSLHVIAGTVSLISGLIAMSYGKKGGKIHNMAGIVFYWAMAVIFATTILFVLMYPTNLKYQFFLTIGIVSFYPTWSGKRVLEMKKGLVPNWYDWLFAIGIGISGLVMISYSVYCFLDFNVKGTFGILFLIFGIVSVFNSYGDIKYYLNFKQPIKMHWFFAHGGKMMGAYSAALTAFCVNVVPRYLPQNTSMVLLILVWAGPGLLIGIIAKRLLKKYKLKYKIA